MEPKPSASDSDKALQDGVKVTSGRKIIGYDAEASRFFETNDGECVPEDEYCPIDEKTGQKIRLTVQEKERIFLDALQVRTHSLFFGIVPQAHTAYFSNLHTK